VCPFPGTRVWSYTTVNKCAWNPTKLSTSATHTSRGRGTNEDTNGLLWQYFSTRGIDPSVHSAPGLDLGIRRAQRPVTYRVGFPNRSNKIGPLILALTAWIRRSSLGHGCVAWMSPASFCCWRVRWPGISRRWASRPVTTVHPAFCPCTIRSIGPRRARSCRCLRTGGRW
jgi:hypothetical protein